MYGGTDVTDQVKGPGEPRGVRRSVPPIGRDTGPERRLKRQILEQGEGADKVEEFLRWDGRNLKGEGFEGGP